MPMLIDYDWPALPYPPATEFSDTPAAIVREYFPDATDGEVSYILWNHTGFPCFWHGDPETCLRQQLEAYRNGEGEE